MRRGQHFPLVWKALSYNFMSLIVLTMSSIFVVGITTESGESPCKKVSGLWWMLGSRLHWIKHKSSCYSQYCYRCNIQCCSCSCKKRGKKNNLKMVNRRKKHLSPCMRNLRKKVEIVAAIKPMHWSGNTITRRIEMMAKNVFDQIEPILRNARGSACSLMNRQMLWTHPS